VARTRILPFLNIGATGMVSPEVGELEDLRCIDRAAALRVIDAHRDLIQGVKVRLSRDLAGANARVALTTALEVSEAAGLPIMVHVGDTDIPLARILDELRPGDVLTHCFHGREEGILDARGRVLAEARRAAGRGVHLDVGHGQEFLAAVSLTRPCADGEAGPLQPLTNLVGDPFCSVQLALSLAFNGGTNGSAVGLESPANPRVTAPSHADDVDGRSRRVAETRHPFLSRAGGGRVVGRQHDAHSRSRCAYHLELLSVSSDGEGASSSLATAAFSRRTGWPCLAARRSVPVGARADDLAPTTGQLERTRRAFIPGHPIG